MAFAKVSAEALSERTGLKLVPSPLLEECFVHRSVLQDDPSQASNERLEFLGDSIVGQIVAEYLYENYPESPEGELSRMKAAVVSEPSLSEAALRLRLYEFLEVGESEKDTGLALHPSILCDVFEALTAAILLSNGEGAAKRFVLEQLGATLKNAGGIIANNDPKSALQVLTQSVFRSVPEYVTEKETGLAHNKTFTVSVLINGRRIAESEGKSKKAAEKSAAAKALEIAKSELEKTWDVCVVGAGLAGVSAAVAAARAGASVVICDRLPGPGGLAVFGLVNPFMTHCSSDGKPLVGGLFDEIRERLKEKHALRVNCFDSEAMKEALSEMLAGEENIEFLPENGFVSAERASREAFAVTLDKRFVLARRVVDASGDAVLARSLGAETMLGDENGDIQAATLMFDVGGVEIKEALRYAAGHPEDFLFPKLEKDDDINAVSLANYSPAGFFSLVEKAKREKGYDFPGDMVFFLYRKTQSPKYDAVVFNQTHVGIKDPCSAAEIKRGKKECTRQAEQVLAFLREYVPGFRKAYLLKRADLLGIRESYRVKGACVFSAADVRSGRKHRDRVCSLAYPVDVHAPSGEGYSIKESKKQAAKPAPGDWYDIPYRCLTAADTTGLLCCGRIISATQEGMGAIRIMPAVIATGQAAGAAAALSALGNVAPEELDYKLLKPYLALIQ
ncbi:MAG: ribonuclease III [Abditibacteriota bacterium]|nr:ribonuclease III [Abditibacteriota bacterium]